MQKTMYAILTNEEARSVEAIEESLDREFSVGYYWFDKPALKSLELQKDISE